MSTNCFRRKQVNDRLVGSVLLLPPQVCPSLHSDAEWRDRRNASSAVCGCSGRLDVDASSSTINYASANTSTRLMAAQWTVTVPRQVWRLRSPHLRYAVSLQRWHFGCIFSCIMDRPVQPWRHASQTRTGIMIIRWRPSPSIIFAFRIFAVTWQFAHHNLLQGDYSACVQAQHFDFEALIS